MSAVWVITRVNRMTKDKFEITESMLATAKAILRAGPICDECLGRAFAKVGHGFSNAERGAALRIALEKRGTKRKNGVCWVCGGIFDQIDGWAQKAREMSSGFEYRTFLFGAKLNPRIIQAEKLFRERFPTDAHEPLKHAFNRQMGKAFEAQAESITVDFDRPDIWFVVSLSDGQIDMKVRSLYVYGRYRKLVRGIPQTRWPCRKCGGVGCEACNFTGKQYPESVEELIAAAFLKQAGANEAYLHGAGREDIDARMLGSGRPFVLEVASPHMRSLDLCDMKKQVNALAASKVEVSDLRFVTKDAVALVKETRARKTYRARVLFSSPVDGRRLTSAVSSLVGLINQQTPLRVAHRRADLVRLRRLISGDVKAISDYEAELVLCGEGGLYIKELISGDQGRTRPSLSEVLGVTAKVTQLDVIDVSDSGFPDLV